MGWASGTSTRAASAKAAWTPPSARPSSTTSRTCASGAPRCARSPTTAARASATRGSRALSACRCTGCRRRARRTRAGHSSASSRPGETCCGRMAWRDHAQSKRRPPCPRFPSSSSTSSAPLSTGTAASCARCRPFTRRWTPTPSRAPGASATNPPCSVCAVERSAGRGSTNCTGACWKTSCRASGWSIWTKPSAPTSTACGTG